MANDKTATRKKRGEVDLQDFKYVDIFHQNPSDGKRTKWIRVEVGEAIEAFRNKHNNYNVFATVQAYKNKVRQANNELMYAPLFFDIDSARTLAKDYDNTPPKPGLVEEGMVSVAELQNLLAKDMLAHITNSEMGIPISEEVCRKINSYASEHQDLKDFIWIKNLEQSRADAVKIVNFFIDRFGFTEDEIRVYFSGSKGFHVLVNPIVLGVQPDRDLHRIFKLIANYLEAQLRLRSVDGGSNGGSIYAKGRMLRLVNSIHYKSGLFKVELTHEELKGDVTKIINELAKSPREDFYPEGSQELQVRVEANEWYLAKVKEFNEGKRLEEESTALKDEALASMEDVPACVQFILERGILKTGDRNKATMALASYYKDTGTPIGEARKILVDWAAKIPSSMTSSAASEVKASTETCVKTVYQEDKYHFQCSYIRSLHGEGNGKDYEAVPCAGRICAAHEEHAITEEPAQFMHLAQTAKAEYTGHKVAFNALVSGTLDTPYIVPKIVRYVCRHHAYCDKECIMDDHGGMYEREFHDNDRFLLEATNKNDNDMRSILRQHSKASCNKVTAEVIETANVTEMLVVPMADRIKSVKTDEGDIKDTDESGNSYVTRKIYAVGDGVQSNHYYRIEGYVYSHPKNSMATVLSQQHIPLEDSIGSFELTDDVKERFKIFQVQQGETVDDRISLVIQDIVDHVTLVRERFQPHLAALLTFHSCLHYYFQNRLEKRGWLETIFVGDSGQAKSQLVNNIMEFCGLGNTVASEGAGRTGLIYRLEQFGDRWFIIWGKYPLSDRKLIAIDEFAELSAEDFGKITEARTTGVLKVDRAVNTETNARVRLILLSNPKGSKTLDSYTCGVESLKPLFASPADIRRLDLAVFLRSGDTSRSVLNAEYDDTKKQLISSTTLRDSILWAWSRKAEDIEISKKAMKLILEEADLLGEKYGYAKDIPLMEPADLRKKLARLSIAMAAFVHSTDANHEKILVNEEHVEAVVNFLTIIYDDNNSRLDVYSARGKEETELTEEERVEVSKALEDLDFGDNGPVSAEIIDLFRKNDILKPIEIIDMLGYERSQVNTRLSILTKHSMIKRTREGLRKLPKFIEFLLD